MKGDILQFDSRENTGMISGHDGVRYYFTRADWSDAANPPIKGMAVDFECDENEGKRACDVIPLTPSSAETPVSRLVFILLAVLVGIFGVHNFVAGYNGKGTGQLILTVVSLGALAFITWIWAIVEAITVTEDAKGVPFT